ncbi:MAG TPA: flippase activity-associated protein Agl23 [Pyrinomonadaceae bacterium]
MANTASTKSGGSKKAQARTTTAVETKSNRAVEAPANVSDIPESVWRIGAVVIFLIAAVLRLYDLNLVPLHHDEGVNGNFLVRLVREGAYQYDPGNYHGPTLYYFAAFFPWVMRVLFGKSAQENYGLTTVSIRMVPALFGLGTIALIFLLRRHLGTIATLTAALLLSVSPGAVYLSRYFIHETLFVFFTLGIVVASLYFYEQRNGFYLILASASAALLFATKETAMISVGVLIIALVVTQVYLRLRRGKTPAPKTRGRSQRQPGFFGRLVADFGGPTVFGVYVAVAVVVFAALWVLFYSSFFTNSKGISDSFKTFEVWTKTGTVAHVHPFLTYSYWLTVREGPLLFLGVAGALCVVLKPKNSFALFSALWAFGMIAAYSLIPYKTPWLMLSFLVPLALISGYAFQVIYAFDKRVTGVVLFVVLSVAVYQTIDLNFFNYDNDDSRYVYVYAHTTRGMLELVRQIDSAAKQENGNLTGITIVSPDYWPLPWYLRNYTRVGYFGRLAASTEPLIIANENQQPDVEANFGEIYHQIPSSQPGGSYELRPGVKLLLYQRRKGFTPPEPPLIHRP